MNIHRLIISGLIVLGLCLSLCSCFYMDIKTPLDTDVRDTQLGPKVGRSSAVSILWLVAWGDAGTAAAANDGGITTITHLDRAFQSYFFGLYSQRETIAYGQ